VRRAKHPEEARFEHVFSDSYFSARLGDFFTVPIVLLIVLAMGGSSWKESHSFTLSPKKHYSVIIQQKC
jgi:hypothetical protein